MLLNYLKNPKQTGALCSSSKQLACIMIKDIEIEKADNIIEIGPGSGVFTQYIIEKKKQSAKFFTIEINKNMAKKLHRRFYGLDIEVGSAEYLLPMMKKRDMQSADIIISGIPWALLSRKEQGIMLRSIYDALKPRGYFTTFAYVIPTPHANWFKKRIFHTFECVELSHIVWQNIPPAFVYYCKK